MSADQDVDDSFISIKIKNVGGGREDRGRNICFNSHEWNGMSRETNFVDKKAFMLPCLLWDYNAHLCIACL